MLCRNDAVSDRKLILLRVEISEIEATVRRIPFFKMKLIKTVAFYLNNSEIIFF